MWIAKKCGIRNHDAAIAVSPERPLIRPRDARNEGGERGAFGRKPRIFTKETDGAAEQTTRMNVGDKADEIASGRIKRSEPNCWISLRSRRVRKIPDRFQTDHGGNLIAASFAPARVNKTSYLRCLEIGRFFIHKRDEA